MSKYALVLDKVAKDFGNIRAVDRLSLKVSPGEIYGLLGPNGSGKTVVMKMINGLYGVSRGKITVSGFDIASSSTKAKRRIGYVPDNPVAYDKLTGREFLEFIGELYGMNRERREEGIVKYLSAYGIEEIADGYFSSFSRGVKQKIVLAAALMHNPSLIVIDEPMVGLDPSSILVTRALLRAYADDGGAVLLSTHTLTVAENLCNRFGVLYRGRLVAEGTLDELRCDVGSKRTSLESVFLKLVGRV